MIKPSEEIQTSDQFPILCNARGVREALLVGVDQCEYAVRFVDSFLGRMLHLVDPYLPYEEMPGSRTADLMVATQAMAPFHGRFKFHLLKSQEAVKHLPEWIRPAFVYLDAATDYNPLRMDIDGWWRRLPEKGILAGRGYQESFPGVIASVDEFAEREGVTIRLVKDDDGSVSWYAYRTEPALFRRLYP